MDGTAETVSVAIVGFTDEADGTATTLTYEVVNRGRAPIWLVADDWVVWKREGDGVEIGLARGRLRPGAQVFGYFPPAVVEVPVGGSVRRAVRLAWPLPLSGVWNAVRRVERPRGMTRVSVRVGYGLTPAPEAPGLGEGVEAPVFRWQREAVSPPAFHVFL